MHDKEEQTGILTKKVHRFNILLSIASYTKNYLYNDFFQTTDKLSVELGS